MSLSHALSAIALAAIVVPPASAAEPGINIAGQWTFTANLQLNCDFGGTAHLTKTADNKYKVELNAQQSCPSLEEDYLVRQDCVANQFGNQLSVRCTIAEFINGFESEFYYPDNFTLTIASGKRMHGALVSSGNANPAEWKRSEGGIS